MAEVRNLKLPHQLLHHGIAPTLQTFFNICNLSYQQLLSQDVHNCWGRWRHQNSDTDLNMYSEPVKAFAVLCSSADSQPYWQSLATSHCQPALHPSSCITRGLNQTGKVYSHCLPQIDNWVLPYIIHRCHAMKESLSRPQNRYTLAAFLDQTRLFMAPLSTYTNTLWVAGAIFHLSSSFFSQLLGHL